MPELPLLDTILHNGQLAFGKYGNQFEEKLKQFYNCNRLIVTNTYNMSILVALTTAGIQHGDEVIVSPMACLASTQPLLSLGLKIIWGDVDPQTGTLCPESVQNKLATHNIRAIVHNHFCGYPGYIDEINQLGRQYGILVIDDCIEAFGSEYKGRKMGQHGTDITIFSFNPVRLPNTLDGGAVLFASEELYRRSILVRDAGIDRSRFRDELAEINPDCDISIVGHSATPMEINSYIGVEQMKHVARLIELQRENGRHWDAELHCSDRYKPLTRADANPNYWVYGILTGNKRETIRHFRAQGYYASGVHINNNIYSVFGPSDSLPGVNAFYNHFVALPSGWWYEK